MGSLWDAPGSWSLGSPSWGSDIPETGVSPLPAGAPPASSPACPSPPLSPSGSLRVSREDSTASLYFLPKDATCLFPGIGPNLSKCPQTPILCWACRREVQICASLLVSPTRTLTMDSVPFSLLGVPDIHTGGEALASSRTHSVVCSWGRASLQPRMRKGAPGPSLGTCRPQWCSPC